MQVLKWTQPRLQRLFRYYNTRYWGGELPEFRVVNRRLKKGIAGWYDYTHKTIWIDLRPEKIPADRYVKQVVLHECCHVATRQSRGPHGARFFHEVLRLIGLGSRWAARDWLEFDDAKQEIVEATPECLARLRQFHSDLREQLSSNAS